MDEINHLQKADQKNIVRSYGLVEWEGCVGIIMEYLPNGNLMEMLRDKDVETGAFLSLRMCAEIASGLAFIHNLQPNKRLVHGDLKAENILLSDDLHCKIADFGSSLLSSYTGNTSTALLGNTWENKFTEIYAAPELLSQPSMKLKPSHDVYSYSMIVFLVVSRENVLAAHSVKLVYLEGIRKGNRPDINISEKLAEATKQCKASKKALMLLISVIRQCWTQKAEDRPDMLEVRNLLTQELNEIPSASLLSQIPIATARMSPTHFNPSKCRCESIDKYRPVHNRASGGQLS